MSNYRDDTQETAVASSYTWAGLAAITEESAKIASALVFGLMVLHTGSAAASDEVFDSATGITVEQAAASDTVLDAKRASILTIERATIAEHWAGALRVVHEDTAAASDAVLDSVFNVITEHAQATDEVIASRSVATLVVESARAFDTTLQATADLVSDSAAAGDWSAGILWAKVLTLDAAVIADETFGGGQASAPAADSARISAAAFDSLAARDLVTDSAMAEDTEWSNLPPAGQAWTANADTWAMSRYDPYSFTGLAVIDGVLYGTTADGVYALDADDQATQGRISTGKLDIGKGALVHPTSAILEYELDGTAELDVTTTQSGQAETYTYELPQELAGELTNGRFVLGRGLRGRHFSLTLRLTGTHGYINDFSVQAAPTKRRV